MNTINWYGIHDHEEHRVTCGNCNHSWCESCDPAPSAMCHWCNGMGESFASLEPVTTYTLLQGDGHG